MLLIKGNLVGTAGFEPATTTPPVWCATRLRYAPRSRECEAGIILNEPLMTSLFARREHLQHIFQLFDGLLDDRLHVQLLGP